MLLKNLETIKEKIKTPETWCYHAFARNKDGNNVSWHDKEACQWCLWGAINSCVLNHKELSDVSYVIRKSAQKLYGIKNLIELNDSLRFEAVHQVLDGAINEARNG